jgi:hypothetical protein
MTLRVLAVAAVLSTTAYLGSFAAAAPGEMSAAADPADALMKKMLDALKARRFEDFVADGTPKLKSLAKQSFALVSAHFSPLLLGGYKTTYLARLRKPDLAISLWKLEPTGSTKGVPEDFEIRVVLKAGKVDAFSIQ